MIIERLINSSLINEEKVEEQKAKMYGASCFNDLCEHPQQFPYLTKTAITNLLIELKILKDESNPSLLTNHLINTQSTRKRGK